MPCESCSTKNCRWPKSCTTWASLSLPVRGCKVKASPFGTEEKTRASIALAPQSQVSPCVSASLSPQQQWEGKELDTTPALLCHQQSTTVPQCCGRLWKQPSKHPSGSLSLAVAGICYTQTSPKDEPLIPRLQKEEPASQAVAWVLPSFWNRPCSTLCPAEAGCLATLTSLAGSTCRCTTGMI